MQHRDHSSDDSTLIQPAEFSFGCKGDAQQPSQQQNSHPTAPSGSRHQRLLTTAIGAGLLLGLVGVFWGLPQVVEKPQVQLPTANNMTNPGAVPSKIKESPYSDAEIAQQRRQVQKILQDILILQEELQERHIEQWAGEEFSAAQALAEQADDIYRLRRFKQALETYETALSALQQLRDSIPERIEQQLAKGNEALDSGDAEAAHKAFDMVLTISEDHPRGVKGKARADVLPQAWQHFSNGKEAFAQNALGDARDALQQALQVDPLTRPASELLPQVLAAITERDYSEAMSAGYSAISAGDFEAAKKSFKRAQQLKPLATEPATGLQQADNGLEQSRIDRLFARAREQEASEEWHAAAKNYQKLLEKDGSLVSAITGKARTDARAELDDQLEDLLKDPLTLSGSKRNKYARKILADARQVNGNTPRLEEQIEKLENALTRALIPIPVRLQSDSNTHVTIYHVGQLGNFTEREIPLKPGRYTAVGTREGYRDVRREFTVDPVSEPPTIVIQCAEKINGVKI